MRLALDTEFSANSKILAVPALIVLELLICTKKNCKIWIGNKETANHPWTASPKGRCRSLECS
jgi:hypothetical protein